MFEPSTAVSQLKPAALLHHVLESEEKLWGQSVVFNSSSLNDVNGTGDIGTHLLSIGCTVKEIHGYFSNLEYRKCGLRLAAKQTTFTNLRLVRSEGRDSGIDEGSMLKGPCDNNEEVLQLSVEEFHLFKHAYLCASFPVLGAPTPPSPYSPEPNSSPKSQQNRFSLETVLTSLNRPETPYFNDSGIEEADDFSIIPAETLYEHLRRVFHLSTDTFKYYERMIINSMGSKTAPKMLIDDLVGQLAALENNSNPFYCPKNFITREGYDLWQQMERSHITEMISKFWHFSLPSINQNSIIQLNVVHQEYTNLLEKLIRFESQFRYDIDDIGPPPTSPLSSASVRLLKEFGLRYGIGEMYRRTVYLNYLTTHFDTTVWFVQHLIATQYTVMELLPNNKTQLVMVKKELQILEDTEEIIIGQASKALTKMKSLYPGNRPPDGVVSLIELISRSLRIQSSINIRRVKPLEHHLLSVIMEIFPTTYEAHKMVAMAELKQNKWTEQLSPKLLNMLIGNIREEVMDYKVNYQAIFESFFDITELAAKYFYSCLIEDVEILLENREHLVDPSNIDLLLLSLAYRLDQLDFDWAKYVPTCKQKWRDHFQTETFRWLTALKIHTKKLVIESVARDKCGATKLTVDTSISLGSSSGGDNRDRSMSCKSLTPSLTSAFSSISSRSTPSSVVRPNSLSESKKIQCIPENSKLRTDKSRVHSEREFTVSYDGMSSGMRKNIKYSTLNVDSKSLVDYDEEDEVFVAFSGLRHSNSLPDIHSGSYEEHGPHLSTANSRKVSHSTQHHVEAASKLSGSRTQEHPQASVKFDTNTRVPVTVDDQQAKMMHFIDDSDSSTITDDESISSGDAPENIADKNPYPPLQEIDMGGFSFQKWKQSQMTNVSSDSSSASKTFKTNRPLSCDKTFYMTISGDLDDLDTTGGIARLHDVNVPMSGSVVDVIVICQRVVEFAETLGQVINGSQMKNSSKVNKIGFVRMNSEEDNVRMCVSKQTEKMYERFVKMLCDILYVFADNMICMDLCGTSIKQAQKIAGPQLIEYLQIQRDSGFIWGCRHEAAGSKDCLEFVDKNAEFLCDRYESISQEMCTRINNVASMLTYLKIYLNKLGDIFESNQSKRLRHEQTAMYGSSDQDSSPSLDYEFLESYKYDATQEKQSLNHPSLCGWMGSQMDGFVQPVKDQCYSHLLAVVRSQCRLLAYRINLFIRDAIRMLLKLKHPCTSVDVCLQPVTDFLKIHVDSLHSWLYRDCFGKVMECLWVFIVQDFEEQLNFMRMQDHNTESEAQHCVHALMHLLKFFNNHDRGIKKDLLLAQSDDVIFKLHLLAMSSMRLITLYQQLIVYCSDQENTTSSISAIQHHLYKDLQKYNKCFSGHALVKWILHNSVLFYRYEYLLSGRQTPTNQDQAVDIGQIMLDLRIIADIEQTSLYDGATFKKIYINYNEENYFIQHRAQTFSDPEAMPPITGRSIKSREHATSVCSTTDTGSLNYPEVTLHGVQPSQIDDAITDSELSTPRASPTIYTTVKQSLSETTYTLGNDTEGTIKNAQDIRKGLSENETKDSDELFSKSDDVNTQQLEIQDPIFIENSHQPHTTSMDGNVETQGVSDTIGKNPGTSGEMGRVNIEPEKVAYDNKEHENSSTYSSTNPQHKTSIFSPDKKTLSGINISRRTEREITNAVQKQCFTQLPERKPVHILSTYGSSDTAPLHDETNVDTLSNEKVSLNLGQQNCVKDERKTNTHLQNSSPTEILRSKMYKSNMSSPVTAQMSTPNSTQKFSDGRHSFYCVAPPCCQKQSKTSTILNFDYELEESTLVCQCFERKIHPDFLLQIIYTRRKHDPAVKKFVKTLPSSAVAKVKSNMELTVLECVSA